LRLPVGGFRPSIAVDAADPTRHDRELCIKNAIRPSAIGKKNFLFIGLCGAPGNVERQAYIALRRQGCGAATPHYFLLAPKTLLKSLACKRPSTSAIYGHALLGIYENCLSSVHLLTISAAGLHSAAIPILPSAIKWTPSRYFLRGFNDVADPVFRRLAKKILQSFGQSIVTIRATLGSAHAAFAFFLPSKGY